MTIKPYIEPKDRLPHAVRMRNRAIALIVFVFLCAIIGSCIFGGDEKVEKTKDSASIVNSNPPTVTDTVVKVAEVANKPTISQALAPKTNEETIEATRGAVTEEIAPENPPKVEVIDSAHIKSQKDVFLAEKIDQLLRRNKPENAIILMVDAKSNEILAWGERKDSVIQNQPDFLIRNTFPAASLAKTITIAAGLESKRYSLNTPIPMIGMAHHLYRNQLRVKENYSGPTIELQDAYAKSANPPIALIGLNVGAKKLRDAAHNLGYNMNFAGGLPLQAQYAPPDTGYALAETACGFTTSTKLPPLLAAAQARAILMKKPLEIPWSTSLEGFAPKQRLALNVGTFSENTYYGLREAMLRSVTAGTARKQVSTRNMARKNFEALNIGGKTGSLDGNDPPGRYDWFMGFAESKEDPSTALIIVVLQIYDTQGLRPQPTTQVVATLINQWAFKYVTNKKK